MHWKLNKKWWVVAIKFWLPTVTVTHGILTLTWIVIRSDFSYENSNMAGATYKLFTSRMVSYYLSDTYPVSLWLCAALSLLMLLTQLFHHGRTVRRDGIIHVIGYFGVVLCPTHPTKTHIREMDRTIPHYVSAAVCFISFAAYLARVVRDVGYTTQNDENLSELDGYQIKNLRLALNLWRSLFWTYFAGLIVFFVSWVIMKYGGATLPKVEGASTETLHYFIVGEWMMIVSAALFYAPFTLLNGLHMTPNSKDGRTQFRRLRTERCRPAQLFLPWEYIARTETGGQPDPGFKTWFKQHTQTLYTNVDLVPESIFALEGDEGNKDAPNCDLDAAQPPKKASHPLLMRQVLSRQWTLESADDSRRHYLQTIQEDNLSNATSELLT